MMAIKLLLAQFLKLDTENTHMYRTLFFTICLVFSLGWSSAQNGKAEKVESKYFKRLYQLNDAVYRSEQPSKKGFRMLEEMGVRSVVNFRRNKKDDNKARKTQLTLEHLPLKTKELTYKQIATALKIIQSAEKPILIHCWHGSDRTGVISAAYRIVFEDWQKEEAIKELRKPEFGYHENWYPNVVDLLMNMDVQSIKQELQIN